VRPGGPSGSSAPCWRAWAWAFSAGSALLHSSSVLPQAVCNTSLTLYTASTGTAYEVLIDFFLQLFLLLIKGSCFTTL